MVFTALELWWIGKTVARAQGSVVPPADAEREVYLNEPGDDWRQAWDVTEALLARVQDDGRRNGVPLLVVLSPSRVADLRRSLAEARGNGDQARRRFSPTAPNERLAEIAEPPRHHAAGPAPESSAPRSQAGGPPVIFRKDGHWTEHGHEVAARAVADAVQYHALTGAPTTAH